jgi:Uncharacterised nucleotidyltransferase
MSMARANNGPVRQAFIDDLFNVPEFRTLCLAARWPHHFEDAQALYGAAAEVTNWAAVVGGARRHRVTSLVLSALQASGCPHVPAEVIAELRRQSLAAGVRNLAQVRECGRLNRIFAAAGIRVLVLKGVALSIQLYREPALRETDDIDLLVDREQFWAADATLTDAGYQHSLGVLSTRKRAIYLHWIKEIRYFNTATGVSVELHHRLTANPHLLPGEFDAIWSDHETVRVGQTAIATLSRHRLALYLCAHGAGHCWERLRWLTDLAAVLREPADVDAALTAAAAVGFGPAMLQAIALARNWLGLSVSDNILTAAAANPQVARLDRILANFFAGSGRGLRSSSNPWERARHFSLWLWLYSLSLKSDWRYRAHELAAAWICPADWQIIHLPDALFWLYPLLRPVGWVRRH